MANPNNKKQNKTKSRFNPVGAAVTGAIVGAGVAIAGAVALKDKKNRAKVKQVFTDIKDQAIGYMEDMKKQVQDKEGEVEEKLAESKKKVKKLVNETKKSLQKEAKDVKKVTPTKKRR